MKGARRQTSLFRKAASAAGYRHAPPVIRGAAGSKQQVQVPVRALNYLLLVAVLAGVLFLLFKGIPKVLEGGGRPEPTAPAAKPGK